MTMTDKNATLIGYLTDVRKDGMEARLIDGDEGARLKALDSEQVLVGQIGTFVSIRQNKKRLLAVVVRDTAQNPVVRPEMAPVALPPEDACNSRHISLIPLGEVVEKGGFQRGVKHFPTTGAEVHAASIGELRTIFMDESDYCLEVGVLSNYRDLTVSLDPSALFGRHFAILGQSGSGKSWAVASLLQRAVSSMPKAHIILLDLHGEYCWRDEKTGVMHSAFDESLMRYMDARELEIPYWLLSYTELVDLLVDRVDANASMQMAFLRETLYALKKEAADALGLKSFSIDSPIYFSLSELYRHFRNANEYRTEFGKLKGAMHGQFDEFLIKLQSRLNDVRYDFLLRPKLRTTSASLSGLLRDFVGLGEPKRPITVVDLSSVPFDVRPSVSAQIGRLAFEFNYWNPRNREFPIVLVCEEAHAYIPRESGGEYEKARKAMERIAKEGRKYGVGLCVVSQRPHELSETVLSQCSTFLCFRTTNPDDQLYVRSLVPEAERQLIDILAALGRGEALALGEAAPLPTRFQFFKPEPPPNSNDVDYLHSWNEGPDDLDVESIADRWRRQGR